MPAVVDGFDFRGDCGGVIYKALSDLRVRSNLTLDAPVGSAKIVKRPIRDAVLHLGLVNYLINEGLCCTTQELKVDLGNRCSAVV